MTSSDFSMGGHFSAFIKSKKFSPPGNLAFESARSSLFALLSVLKPARLLIPNYCCDAIDDAANAASVRVEKFSLVDGFRVSPDLTLAPTDLILVVNYFGLADDAISDALNRFPLGQIIVDCSQAYFADVPVGVNAIFSPRKFLPVPDGGFLQTSEEVRVDLPDEVSSIRRYEYLLRREGAPAADSRHLYLSAENDLANVSTRAMSSMTANCIAACDTEFISNRRRSNFSRLRVLDRFNLLRFDLCHAVPLCYPLMLPYANDIRDSLLKKKIYLPKYWPGISPDGDFEEMLCNNTIFLPIDHRYDDVSMDFLIDLLCEIL